MESSGNVISLFDNLLSSCVFSNEIVGLPNAVLRNWNVRFFLLKQFKFPGISQPTIERKERNCSLSVRQNLNLQSTARTLIEVSLPGNSRAEEIASAERNSSFKINPVCSEANAMTDEFNIFASFRDATLLEKANEFKKNDPETWQKRQKEREKNISAESEEMDRFFESYYQQQEEEWKQKKEEEQKNKFAIPKLVLQLKHHLPSTSVSSENDEDNDSMNLYENYKFVEKNEESGFLSFIKSNNDKKEQDEFHIVVLKGKFLLNYIAKDAQKYEHCRVCCYFYPGSSQEEKKLKSNDVYVTYKGKARWEQVFALKGYTMEELKKSYANLVVFGIGQNGKEVIGKVVVSGKQANIWEEKTNSFREPTANEEKDWEKALENPDATILTTLDLPRSINPTANSAVPGLLSSITQVFSDVKT